MKPDLACRRALLAAALFLSLACGPASEPAAVRRSPRVVILFAVCTLNSSYISPYNPEIRFTPSLDKLASTGVVATKHRTESSLSGIAYASLYTGLRTARHGAYVHPATLPDDTLLIGEVFAAAGYETLAFMGHKFTRDRGYDQGAAPEDAVDDTLVPGHPVLERALERLKRDDAARLFVLASDAWLHDYLPRRIDVFCGAYPEECRGASPEELTADYRLFTEERYALQYDFERTVQRLGLSPDRVDRIARSLELLYRASVFELDVRVGGVLADVEAAGLMDDAIVVVTADHGESMLRSDRPFQWAHGGLTSSDVMGVPLIVYDTDWAAPRRYEHVTRAIDLLPTVAGLAGVPLPPGARFDGIDLSDALLGAAAPALEAFSHTGLLPLEGERGNVSLGQRFWTANGRTAGVTVRSGDRTWSIPFGAQPDHVVAYDLAADPREAIDRFDPSDPTDRRMAEVLRAYKLELERGFAAEWTERGRLPEEELELLRSLGYVH